MNDIPFMSCNKEKSLIVDEVVCGPPRPQYRGMKEE